MGYLRRDAVIPAVSKYNYSLKFKNIILKHWPTTTVNGVKVFARLYIYQSGYGIYQTPAHLAIYKLLGMTVKQLQAGKYDGIENTWMYVQGTNISYDISQIQVKNYIDEFSPVIYPASKDPFNPIATEDTRLNPDEYRDNPVWVYGDDGVAIDSSIPEPQWDKDGWITEYLTYQPISTADVPESISDSGILSLIELGNRSTIHFDEEEGHPLIFASILDVDNVMFENKVRIVQKTIEERTTNTYTLNSGSLSSAGSTTSRYLKTAVIEYKFRRVKSTTDPLVATLIAKIETEMDKLSVEKDRPAVKWLNDIRRASTFGDSLNSSVSKQLIRMYHHKLGDSENDLSYNGKLKYDAMATLKVKDFGKVFIKQIKQGYKLKKVKWYKKLLVIVIDIIVVIIIVILVITGNYWAIPLVLSLGALTQSMLAGYWARTGDPAAAQYAMNHAEVLSDAATITGALLNPGLFLIMTALDKIAENSDTGAKIVGALKILYIVYKIYSGMNTPELSEAAKKEAADAAAKEAARQATMSIMDRLTEEISNLVSAIQNISMDNIVDVSLDAIVPPIHISTSMLLLMSIELLNESFTYYMTVLDPPPSIEDKSKQLAESEKDLEDASGPEMIDTINIAYSDPYTNWIDFNEKMQSAPNLMTHGKNVALMNKYYKSGY